MIRCLGLCRLPAIALVLLLFASPAAWALEGTVTRVYDGDTLEVSGVGTVRLIGIDAPEREASERDDYYLRRGVAPQTLRRVWGEARAFASRHAAGRKVVLTFDRERTDRYGRTLAYVTLPDGRMLNRLLLEEGLAAVYRRFDFRRKASFLAAERRARRAGRGLWADSPPPSGSSGSFRKGGLPVALRSASGAQ